MCKTGVCSLAALHTPISSQRWFSGWLSAHRAKWIKMGKLLCTTSKFEITHCWGFRAWEYTWQPSDSKLETSEYHMEAWMSSQNVEFWCQDFPRQFFPITCKSASWTRKIWKCRNLPEGPLSEEKWRRVLCTTILLNIRSEYVPDRLGKSSCKVQQPRRLSGCNFDISARCISQIIDNILIVNLRRQSTTWKLECHPKMLNSGVRTFQDNSFQ